jgi:hypothetical protein
LSSIQMVEVYSYGGSLFHDVRMLFMTSATYLGSELAETPKRKRMAPSMVTPSPMPKKKPNNRKMSVEILVERLQHGSRHSLKKAGTVTKNAANELQLVGKGRMGTNGALPPIIYAD